MQQHVVQSTRFSLFLLSPRWHTRRMLRLGRLLLVLLGLAGMPGILPALPAQSQASDPPGAADIDMQVAPAFEGNHVPFTWLPLAVALRNDGPDFDGQLVATIPNDPNRYTLAVEMPRGAQRALTLYVPMGDNTRSLLVQLQAAPAASDSAAAAAPAVLASTEIDVRPRRGERLLGIIAAQPPALNLPLRQDMQQNDRPFVVFPMSFARLPDQAAGLRSLTLLLLTEPTSEALSPAQQQALLGWVAGGGHLVLGGGPAARQINAGLPAELRAAEIGDRRELDGTALRALAAAHAGRSAAALAALPALDAVELEPLADAVARGGDETPVLVQRAHVNGLVTQLAFEPGLPTLQDWEAAPHFWDAVLQPAPVHASAQQDGLGLALQRQQTLSNAVSHIPTSNLPWAAPLFALLALYVALVGPGLALLLRRLDRHVWGWVLLPTLALTFGVLAFALASVLRADQRIASQVSLLEQVGAQHMHAQTQTMFLSPEAEQLTLDVAPDALVRPLLPLSSIFGPVNGVVGSFSQQADTLPIAVSRWSLEGVLAEQIIAQPGVEAQIVLDDSGIRAVARNTSDQPVRDVAIAYQRQIARLGDLAPGAEASVPWPQPANSTEWPAPPGTALSALLLPGASTRTEQARVLLVDAATMGGSAANDGPLLLGWLADTPLSLLPTQAAGARQQITLLVARPEIRGASQAELHLPVDWLRPDPASDGRVPCFVNGVQGIALQPAPITLTLRLPPELGRLQASEMTITMESSNPWPNTGVTTELFDWDAQEWVDTNFDGPGDLRLRDAAPFLDEGRVRLRLSGRINEANCLFARATVNGRLP
jgi:hypothetical protein